MSSSTSASEPNRRGRDARAALAILLAALVGAALWIATVERSAVDTIDRVSPFRFQILRLEGAGSGVRVLAIGDSHAGMGFRSPDRRVQSVAWGGENVEQHRLRFDWLRADLPALRAVALQLQPHMFLSSRDLPPEEVRHAAFGQLLDGGPGYHPLERRLRQFDPCCRSEMVALAVKRWLGLALPAVDPRITETGFLRYPNASPRDVEEAAREEIEGFDSLEIVPRLVAEYERLVADLRSEGLEVVLTRFPLSQAYRRRVPALLAAADEIGARLAETAGVHACGAWNADVPVERFFNADHLDEEGARAYWQTLAPCFEAYLGE